MARDQGDRLEWSVIDDGIGIPRAQQEKIFEKFYRAENAVEYSSEGSGLGLYLAKFHRRRVGRRNRFRIRGGKGRSSA